MLAFTLCVETFTAEKVSADFNCTGFVVGFCFKGVEGRAARFTALVAGFEVLDEEVVGSPRGEDFDSLFESQLVSRQELELVSDDVSGV